jgi:AAHS family 4-hydroxybenzoate transporter-like MFS transporter
METPVKLNVSELVDNSKLGAFQTGIFILCGLCLIMDGFDVQAIGYVAPEIIREWHISSGLLGPVFSAAPFGVLIGSLLFSMLADRIGRRPVLIGLTLYFSVLTLLTARVHSVNELLAIRLIAGMGLGGLMPNAVALVGEYSPRRMRDTLIMVVSNGFTAGAAVGGFVSAWLIPAFGWRSVFYFGGATPLLIGVLMFFWLPESLQFMVLKGKAERGKSRERLAHWVKRMDPRAAANSDTRYAVEEKVKRNGVPMVNLFRDGRAIGTTLLWIVNFMNLINLFFLSSWLPTVVRDAGYSASNAVLVGTTLQVGGTIGALALGWFATRLSLISVLTTSFAMACVSIATIGQQGLPLAFLFMVVFVAGWGVVGGQAGVNALASGYYPTDLRATGVGAGLGVGRVGAIVGPVVAGEMLLRNWTARELFIAAAIPALISAVVTLSLRWVVRPGVGSKANEPMASEVIGH